MPRPHIFNPSTSAGGRRQRTESSDSHKLLVCRVANSKEILCLKVEASDTDSCILAFEFDTFMHTWYSCIHSPLYACIHTNTHRVFIFNWLYPVAAWILFVFNKNLESDIRTWKLRDQSNSADNHWRDLLLLPNPQIKRVILSSDCVLWLL